MGLFDGFEIGSGGWGPVIAAGIPTVLNTIGGLFQGSAQEEQNEAASKENAAQRIFQLEREKRKAAKGAGGGGGGGGPAPLSIADKLAAQQGIQKNNQSALTDFIAAYQNAYK